jgi:hypothetical protein
MASNFFRRYTSTNASEAAASKQQHQQQHQQQQQQQTDLSETPVANWRTLNEVRIDLIFFGPKLISKMVHLFISLYCFELSQTINPFC